MRCPLRPISIYLGRGVRRTDLDSIGRTAPLLPRRVLSAECSLRPAAMWDGFRNTTASDTASGRDVGPSFLPGRSFTAAAKPSGSLHTIGSSFDPTGQSCSLTTLLPVGPSSSPDSPSVLLLVMEVDARVREAIVEEVRAVLPETPALRTLLASNRRAAPGARQKN